MLQYFDVVRDMRDDIVAGDLPATQSRARALIARLKNASHPVGWEPQLHPVREAARAVISARTLSEAALAQGQLGVSCGNCHDRLGTKVESETEYFAIEHDESIGENMTHHLNAMSTLWVGLVAASDEHWRDGASKLLSVPLVPSGLAPKTPALELMEKQFRALGQAGLEAPLGADRGQIYGRLLSSCAGCHQLFDGERLAEATGPAH